MGRPGVNRSDTRPPAIRPNASAAVIAPQAAGPPRCSRATTGPSTENAPYQAIITTLNWATITHSQVCERNSDQPSRSSVIMLAPAGSCPYRAASPGWPAAAARWPPCRCRTAERPARSRGRHQQPGHGRAGHLAAVHRQPADRARLLQQVARDKAGEQCLGGGVEDRDSGPGNRLQPDHRPQRGPAGQHKDAEGSLAERHEQVGRDDDPLRPEPVGGHAADEREHQRRRDLGGEHIGQVSGGVGGFEHGERDADDREPDRSGRDQPVGEQQPEVPDPEHGEPAEEPTP